ncbi:LysR family transcriptional regulator [Streptomyces sp. NPDC050610]|uniref:LysR family transcriptional regulator n=1 Tax=Streptomyces sp. NPDC050610 TaxID=3157097 RepID=UPI00343CA24F
MQLPDMNLLPALDALLRESSVTGAAAEMNVSASAMSRTLGRLRRVVGDPLLVPSGRGLVLTPRARALQPQVEAALGQALAALHPPRPVDIATMRREFTIRTNDGLAVVLGAALTSHVVREAPGVRLRVLPEGDEDPADLRDSVDLDIGSMHELPHDVRSEFVLHHHYVAAARAHAPYAREPLTVDRFAAVPHITVSRRGRAKSVVDDRLRELGLRRDVLATVPTHSAACFLALETDALALVPSAFAARAARFMPLVVWNIPLSLPPITIEMAWHLRVDADPAHQWLRTVLAGLAASAVSGGGGGGSSSGSNGANETDGADA